MDFKNKAELINFVKHQTKIVIPNEASTMNSNKNVLYTTIGRANKLPVLSLLQKYNIRYEEHLVDKYFVYLKGGVI